MEAKGIKEDIDNADEISLKKLILQMKSSFQYLFSKWLIILVLGLFGGILGFTYAFLKKPIYNAATTFALIEPGGSSGVLGQYSGIASLVGIDIGGGGSNGIFSGENIIELYKSRTMLQKTLLKEAVFNGKKQLLIMRFIEFNKLKEKWDKPELKNIMFNENQKMTVLQDSVISIIVKDINKEYLIVGKPDKKSSLIKVEVNAKDEAFAKAFNEEIVKNVNDFYLQTKIKKAKENVAILQHTTDSVKAVMNGAIYVSASTSDATPNLNPSRQMQRTVPIQRSQFSIETNKAVLAELIKSLEMSKITLRENTPLIQVIDIPVLPLEKNRFGKAKGIVLGGLLFGFLTVAFLLGSRFLKSVLA